MTNHVTEYFVVVHKRNEEDITYKYSKDEQAEAIELWKELTASGLWVTLTSS